MSVATTTRDGDLAGQQPTDSLYADGRRAVFSAARAALVDVLAHADQHAPQLGQYDLAQLRIEMTSTLVAPLSRAIDTPPGVEARA